jgi:hypothetical protein
MGVACDDIQPTMWGNSRPRADPAPGSTGDGRHIRLHVAWHQVPGDPPGTLRWWDGEAFIARAFWVVDHWEYEGDDWVGRLTAPVFPPGGILTVGDSGWWAPRPHGRWHDGWELPLPSPPPTPVRPATVPERVACVAALAGAVLAHIAGLVGVRLIGNHTWPVNAREAATKTWVGWLTWSPAAASVVAVLLGGVVLWRLRASRGVWWVIALFAVGLGLASILWPFLWFAVGASDHYYGGPL